MREDGKEKNVMGIFGISNDDVWRISGVQCLEGAFKAENERPFPPPSRSN